MVDADNPGLSVTGAAETLDHAMIGGHCDVTLNDCFVPDAAVLPKPCFASSTARCKSSAERA